MNEVLVERAFVGLGDRVIINHLGIQDEQVVVVMTRHSGTDPLCCPTQVVIQKYHDVDGKLLLLSEDVIGTTIGQ